MRALSCSSPGGLMMPGHAGCKPEGKATAGYAAGERKKNHEKIECSLVSHRRLGRRGLGSGRGGSPARGSVRQPGRGAVGNDPGRCGGIHGYRLGTVREVRRVGQVRGFREVRSEPDVAEVAGVPAQPAVRTVSQLRQVIAVRQIPGFPPEVGDLPRQDAFLAVARHHRIVG